MNGMATASLPIPGPNKHHQSSVGTQQMMTPPLSPHSSQRPHLSMTTSEDDLSFRVRKLARSWGEDAVQELSPRLSSSQQLPPLHAPGSFSSASSSSSPAEPPSSAPNSVYAPLPPRAQLPPTPEGGSILEEISEEREEDEGTPSGPTAAEHDGNPLLQAAVAQSMDDDTSDRDNSPKRESMHSRRSSWARSDSFSSRAYRSPVKAALNQGGNNVVVDVHLVDGELLVGSDLATVSHEDSLNTLFLEPLEILFSPSATDLRDSPSRHRRRSSSTSAAYPHINKQNPFHLILHLRTTPSITFQFLLHELTPLRDTGLLTSFCPMGGIVSQSLITISCTGSADQVPWSDIMGLSPRFVFAELEWAMLGKGMNGENAKELTPSVVASLTSDIGWDGQESPEPEVVSRIKDYVEEAHQKGLTIRFSDIPRWPAHARELVKSTLHSLNVDLV